jgi:membrane fusion protein, copper/silver efflux system
MKTLSIFILILLLVGACNTRHAEHPTQNSTLVDTLRYTCPMHPQIIRKAAGKCPICNMSLVEIGAPASDDHLMVSDTQMKLANITTGRVTKQHVGETMVINGTLEANEEHTLSITSRADGRIEKLYVKETGQAVRKGEPLYVLYSEVLLTLQQEFFLAKDQYESMEKNKKRYKSIMDAAERKLILYGLTKDQIRRMTKNSPAPRITFLSPVDGIVTEIQATEGEYIREGGQMFKVEDFSSLWLQAELYSNESSLIKLGDRITVKNSAGVAEAHVTFLSPEYRSNTQILSMRAVIKNPDLKFRPGQQVQVLITRGSHTAMTIPTDAVIRDGNGAHVYVQTARNTFQPRMVKTGVEGFEQIEIQEGLTEGDTLAFTGAYLLYSEMILNGKNIMVGHNH